jgi:hypothetical protein
MGTDWAPTAVNFWLGRSGWATDTLFRGSYEEFRIYDEQLTPLQITINNSLGPDTLITDPGDVVGLAFTNPTRTISERNGNVNLTVFGEFENAPGEQVNLTGTPEMDIVLDNPDNGIVTLLQNPPRIAAVPGATGVTTLTATYNDGSVSPQTATLTVTVIAEPLTIEHRWSFNGNANDTPGVGVTAYNGTLVGATIADGAVDTTTGYVNVGSAMQYLYSDYYFDYWDDQNVPLSDAPIITIEAFVTWNGASGEGTDQNQSIVDFGSVGVEAATTAMDTSLGENAPLGPAQGGTGEAVDRYGRNVFIRNSPTELYGDLTGDGQGQRTGATLEIGPVQHVAMVMDVPGGQFHLFRNGERVSSGNLGNNRDANFIDDFNVWFGRSNDNRQPFWNGTIEEVRIWRGWLTPAMGMNNYYCGPDVLGTAMTCEPPVDLEFTGIAFDSGSGEITLTWQGDGEVQFSPTLPPTWTTVPTTGNSYTVTPGTEEVSGYYRIVGQ